MRVIVFFDLPTKSKKQKKLYTQFRRFLLNDGYDMLQYSVYSRICQNSDSADTHCKRITDIAPKKGSVRVMQVTNKQYADMKIITGTQTIQEKTINHQQLTLF